ncbi:MAG TPA: bifunctional UDP-N-acetylmuramoyl-tripeptide:D-alanyl-D-alanine ligase/alanine racemase [Chitinophagaceae bacterium]|nr:bifunctional UDP-N-acetylmuramoyl-tripeptide:D-alanyl-D-alanine ligase/alanine racemase [Chitinophagaceae bacterium]
MNEFINYTVEQIVKITKGKWVLHHPAITAPTLISIDSRKVTDAAATIFFAIRTKHQDGNRFVESLYARGVRNFVITDKNFDVQKIAEANVILVKDAVRAMQMIAGHHRSLFPDLEVIGITGSNGKTIVKEWLHQLLEENYSIVRSPKSFNSQIGVPLSVLQIGPSDHLGIFEAGISQPGEMQHLEKIIQPTIGLFTNIGEAHDEGFENAIQKIYEKLQLFKNAKHLVYGADNVLLKKAVLSFKNQLKQNRKTLELFAWGRERSNKLQILSVHKTQLLTRIKGIYKGKNLAITIPFTDDASIENAINCWCVLLLIDKFEPKILKRFESLYPVAMRLEQKQGINHCTIINDSYSNDLHSLAVAINFLEQQKQHKKHTIILSDILQSGKSPGQLYTEVAALFHSKNKIRLIGIGPQITAQQHTLSFFKENEFFMSVDEFFKNLSRLNFHDEAILIKGARSFGFEEISHKLEQQLHQTILSINLNALVHNLKQYKSLLQPSVKIMAMVKAFSYGSGGHEIAAVLEYNKADYLAVAYTDEGVDLRKAGITLPLMVMNAENGAFESLIDHHLEPEIFSFSMLNDFENFLRASSVKNYPVHLKIDTGMHRLGFTPEDINMLCEKIGNNPLVKVVSVFTHLVASENKDEDAFTQQQFEVFRKCCIQIETVLGYPVIKHIANTAGISRHPELQMDMVRLGIGLYGIDSNAGMQKRLENVTTLSTTVSQIKNVQAGESVGYGRQARLKRDSVIATVRIGYADGYPRSLGNGVGKMMLHGKMVPVAGNICMDMTMLDVTDIGPVYEGDEVIVFGEPLSLSQLAKWAHTIPYEIMTGISGRVKRIYFEE